MPTNEFLSCAAGVSMLMLSQIAGRIECMMGLSVPKFRYDDQWK